jgi:hypothetical protein
MPELGNEPPCDPYTVLLRGATDEQLAQLKRMTDDQLLRSAGTMDMFASVESTRRLREALHKEEAAIKWLTVVLVVFTLVLVVLTATLVWFGVMSLRH